MRPVLFIGSSSENLDVAYAAQQNLEDCAQVIVWTQGVFGLTKYSLEALLDTLDEAEFGLFVFAPNDLIRMRGQEMTSARDNVIFELGLFIGRLGRKRTFIIMPRDSEDLHLPSDLTGITPGEFSAPENPKLKFLRAALAPACNDIRGAIKESNTAEESAAREGAPKESIDDLGLALSLVLPGPQQKHLLNLAEGKTKGYEGRGSLRSELRNLVSMGLVEKLPGRHIGDMESGNVYDLADFVSLTDRGRHCVERIKAARG